MSFPQHTREQCECSERLPGIHLEWMRRCAVLRLVACRSRKPGSTQISAALLLSFICPALPTISSRVQPPLPAEQLHLENQFHTSHKIHRDLSFKKPTNQTSTFFFSQHNTRLRSRASLVTFTITVPDRPLVMRTRRSSEEVVHIDRFLHKSCVTNIICETTRGMKGELKANLSSKFYFLFY